MPAKRSKKTTETVRVAPEASVAVKSTAKKIMKGKKATKRIEAFNPDNYVVIDHPQEGEIVSGLHYALRFGASNNGSVEVSFDGGEWQPTRNAAGYWWFDWGYFTPGTHTITARLVSPEGKTLKQSPVVTVTVV